MGAPPSNYSDLDPPSRADGVYITCVRDDQNSSTLINSWDESTWQLTTTL